MYHITREAHAMHNFVFILLFLTMCVAAMAAAFSAMMQFYGWAFFALFNMVACAYQEPTKAHYLAEIRKALALPERSGDLTKAELVNVLANLG